MKEGRMEGEEGGEGRNNAMARWHGRREGHEGRTLRKSSREGHQGRTANK
jgi:hypothetical protein